MCKYAYESYISAEIEAEKGQNTVFCPFCKGWSSPNELLGEEEEIYCPTCGAVLSSVEATDCLLEIFSASNR